MLSFHGAALVWSRQPFCSTRKGVKPLWSHPASRWALASGCETFATAKDGEEPTSIFSTVNLNLFLLEWWAHPFPSPQQEQNVTTISRQSSGEVHPLSGGRELEKYSSLPPVRMVKAKSRLSWSVPDWLRASIAALTLSQIGANGIWACISPCT